MYSSQTLVSDGTVNRVDLSIEYLDKQDIQVFVDDALLPSGGYAWTWASDTAINFNQPVRLGSVINIRRTTAYDNIKHIFEVGGAVFKDRNVDENFRQVLYWCQDFIEGKSIKDVWNNLNMHGYRVTNLGVAVDSYDAVSLGQYQADALGAWNAKRDATLAKEAAFNEAVKAANSAREASDYLDTLQNAILDAETAKTMATQASNDALYAKNIVDAWQQGEVLAVDTVANLVPSSDGALSFVRGLTSTNDAGGGIFRYDQTKAAINDGGLVINGWVRQYEGAIKPEFFGAFPDGTDNTAIYNKLIEAAPKGATIEWGAGTYVGSFKSTKELNLRTQPSSILKAPDGALNHVIEFTAGLPNQVTVESQLDRGTVTVTLTGTVDVEIGSLLVFWNGYLRANDSANPVNFEACRVQAVNTSGVNTVVVLSKAMRSRQLGSVTCLVFKKPLSGIHLDLQGKVAGSSNTNWGRGVLMHGCVNVTVNTLNTTGLLGHALSLEYCYDVDTNYTSFSDPASVGSGAGYGLVVWKSSEVRSNVAIGKGMRHVVDWSSAYGVSINYVEDLDAKSSVLALSHNGFCGDLRVGKVVVETKEATYVVNSSSQGYTTNGATTVDVQKRQNHPIWNISIGDIYVKSTASVNANMRALSLDTEMRGVIEIGSVVLEYSTEESPTTSAPSALMYVTGGGTDIVVGTLRVNSARHVLFCRTSSGNTTRSSIKVGSITTGVTDFGIYTGGYDVFVDVFNVGAINRKVAVEVGTSGDGSAYQASHIEIGCLRVHRMLVTDLNPITVASGITLLSGNINVYGQPISTGINVVAGTAILPKDVNLRPTLLSLAAPALVSVASIDIAQLPAPVFYNGQTLTIANGASGQTDRSTVVIPSGTTGNRTISLPSGYAVRYVSVSGKWRHQQY